VATVAAAELPLPAAAESDSDQEFRRVPQPVACPAAAATRAPVAVVLIQVAFGVEQ